MQEPIIVNLYLGGIVINITHEILGKELLLDSKGTAKKIEAWIPESLIDKFSKLRECDISFKTDNKENISRYVPTILPDRCGTNWKTKYLVEFVRYRYKN